MITVVRRIAAAGQLAARLSVVRRRLAWLGCLLWVRCSRRGQLATAPAAAVAVSPAGVGDATGRRPQIS
jgi:hypothetical protein